MLALLASLLLPAPSLAEGDHVHPAPVAPTAGDPRFMSGTVGPVVFRGTAPTVVIPDGLGFGGERGRRQNSGDLRKNNYSVTDANYNNVLGLLPRNPDTGAPLTYVQHIQLYAAAGFLEAWAPDAYAHLIVHQNRGDGTVLGGAGYLMGLVRTYDPAAHGVAASSIPATVPGTDIDARNYVLMTRDATGQEWARPHHAQTAPGVQRMLVEAGLSPSIAFILASDDGISGAGRLNGMNEQDGVDGYNKGERATWAFAAQVQHQLGIPAVTHLMHGHDHAGIHDSALTNPKVNGLIGMAGDDRSVSEARAAALYAALRDGRVATADTAAADMNLTVRNQAFLRPATRLDVDLESFDWHRRVGEEKVVVVRVDNHGPHLARDVVLKLATSPNLQVRDIAAPAGMRCPDLATCHVGDLSGETDRVRELRVTVRFASVGRTKFTATLSSSSPVEQADLVSDHEHAAHAASSASVAMAAGRRAWSTSACGRMLRRACLVRRSFGATFVATARPARDIGSRDPRWIRLVFEQRTRRGWVERTDRWVQVDRYGRARAKLKRDKLSRGVWRVQVEAGDYWLLYGTTSAWRYLVVR